MKHPFPSILIFSTTHLHISVPINNTASYLNICSYTYQICFKYSSIHHIFLIPPPCAIYAFFLQETPEVAGKNTPLGPIPTHIFVNSGIKTPVCAHLQVSSSSSSSLFTIWSSTLDLTPLLLIIATSFIFTCDMRLHGIEYGHW